MLIQKIKSQAHLRNKAEDTRRFYLDLGRNFDSRVDAMIYTVFSKISIFWTKTNEKIIVCWINEENEGSIFPCQYYDYPFFPFTSNFLMYRSIIFRLKLVLHVLLDGSDHRNRCFLHYLSKIFHIFPILLFCIIKRIHARSNYGLVFDR